MHFVEHRTSRCSRCHHRSNNCNRFTGSLTAAWWWFAHPKCACQVSSRTIYCTQKYLTQFEWSYVFIARKESFLICGQIGNTLGRYEYMKPFEKGAPKRSICPCWCPSASPSQRPNVADKISFPLMIWMTCFDTIFSANTSEESRTSCCPCCSRTFDANSNVTQLFWTQLFWQMNA